MDKFVTRSSSNPNLAKRTIDEIVEAQWSFPKRFAPVRPAKNVTTTATSNRFRGLPSDQDMGSMSEPLRNAVQPRKKSGNIPPILIQLQADWSHQKIKDLVTKYNKNFHLQYRNNNKVAVQSYSSESHSQIKAGLLSENVQFHTFSRKDEKMYKTVIRGLPEYFEETLAQELADIGFEGTKVTKLKSPKGNDSKCPPFLVQLPAGCDIAKFRLIRYLGNCAIEIRRFKPNTTTGTQCFRCQGFGHSSHNCNLPARCVKCTDSHATRDCPKKDKKEPARCCNCNQDHPANYRQCTERQKYVDWMTNRRPVVTKTPKSNIPTDLHARVDGRTWSSVVTGSHRIPPSENRASQNVQFQSSLPRPVNPPGIDDLEETTLEMLQILNIIKTLKDKFISCSSMVDKVILVLTHLGQHI